jgi:CRP-like cAMP-binding protein
MPSASHGSGGLDRRFSYGRRIEIGGEGSVAKQNRFRPSKLSTIDWGDIPRERVACEPGATIFRQGDPCTSIIYLQTGAVRLSVVSPAGKEAVIAVLEAGDFFGEGCLIGQAVRTVTATAMSECSLLRIRRGDITRQFHSDESFAESFLSHLLKRSARMQEDLIDQLFNSTEKRLARTLLLLAEYDRNYEPRRSMPKVSQEILAEMVGTTRSRVNFFMNKFRKLGFIDYDASGVQVNDSLVGVVMTE